MSQQKDFEIAASRMGHRLDIGESDEGGVEYLNEFTQHAWQMWQASCDNKDEKSELFTWDDPEVDPIVTKLYRKFKDWNGREFTADDVTWCEVRVYVAELLNEAYPKSAISEQLEAANNRITELESWLDAGDRAHKEAQEMGLYTQPQSVAVDHDEMNPSYVRRLKLLEGKLDQVIEERDKHERLTNLEEFASQNMAAILANPNYKPPKSQNFSLIALEALAAAEALLAALRQR